MLLLRVPLVAPSVSDGKESFCNAGDLGSIPGLERSPGSGIATHSSILAWRIPMDKGAWWGTVHGIARSVRHNRAPARLLCLWDSPGKNTRVGCHALLQGIFWIHGLNLHLSCLICVGRKVLFQAEHRSPGATSYNLTTNYKKLCKQWKITKTRTPPEMMNYN